jgi:hypothetical protein
MGYTKNSNAYNDHYEELFQNMEDEFVDWSDKPNTMARKPTDDEQVTFHVTIVDSDGATNTLPRSFFRLADAADLARREYMMSSKQCIVRDSNGALISRFG